MDPRRGLEARLLFLALGFPLVLGFGGCSNPEAVKSPAELLEENSTVVEELKSYDSRERTRGISRFKKLPKDQGTALILYILSDPKLDDYRLEIILARILADWKDARAIPFLLSGLESPDDGAARIAFEGLVVFGDQPRILAALEELLKSPVQQNRLRAAEALSKIGGEEAVGFLGTAYKGEIDATVRAQMLLGVIKSRHPQRKQFLVDALTDTDQALRQTAWDELKRYRDLPKVEYSPDGSLEDRARAVGELRIWVKGR